MSRVTLEALDGTNPLGFLSALGTLVVAHAAGETGARLAWERHGRWVPVLHGLTTRDPAAFAQLVAGALRGREVAPEADAARAEAEKAFNRAAKAVKDKAREIKARRLAGDERREALERELVPLERERDATRQAWLEALARAAPRPELALGKHLDCTPEEFREHGVALLERGSSRERESLDLLAAFGNDAAVTEKQGGMRIEPTPFCFTAGSGHQYFLDTVRQLLAQASQDRVARTLIEPWAYRDEGLSMRWDPVEDRRYALMDRDPTASGNKPRTVWMANLLAYRALVLFPSAPRGRSLETTGWRESRAETSFTWPLWTAPLVPDVIRSLLQLRELVEDRPDGDVLRGRGVAALYRSQRIRVGSGANAKLNFAPARAVWTA